MDYYKIKEQGFFEPSPIYSYKVLIDRVDQDDHFDPGMTSVGQFQSTQFKVEVSKIASFVKPKFWSLRDGRKYSKNSYESTKTKRASHFLEIVN